MKRREEVAVYLKSELERLRDSFAKNGGGTKDLKPEYYQERLDHFDEILPIYMAGKIRAELDQIERFPNFKELEQYWEGERGKIIEVEDIQNMFTVFGSPNVAMVKKEMFLDEFMKRLGEEIPSVEETQRRFNKTRS